MSNKVAELQSARPITELLTLIRTHRISRITKFDGLNHVLRAMHRVRNTTFSIDRFLLVYGA